MAATFTDDWRTGRITDEALAAMRSQLGEPEEVVVPWVSRATEDAIWHFALGIGDDNPLWWDRRYAERFAGGRMFAPPTLLYTAMSEVRRPGDTPKATGVEEWLPGVLALWAGDRWVWHSRIWVDEPMAATRELHDVREVNGDFAGRALAQTELLRVYGEGRRPIAELYRTLLRFERESSRAQSKYLETPPAVYTPEQRSTIIEQYRNEVSARRGGQPRFWEDVEIGDPIPGLVKGPLTITNIVGWLLGWGSPQCPTNRMLYQWLDQHPGGLLHDPGSGIDDTLEGAHWDAFFARESGMARGYDFGGQRIAWAAHVLTDWCGDAGELVALEARLRHPNFLGDTTWFSGEVTTKEQTDRGALVVCRLTATNQRGEATIQATGTVALPERGAA